MADEIEEFLRRAAARRKQALEQAGSPAARRPRPEYSQRSREREVLEVERVDEEEDVVVEAKVIEPRTEPAAPAEPVLDLRTREVDRSWERRPLEKGSTSMSQLIKTLKSPAGLAQAFLLREILERPEHRW